MYPYRVYNPVQDQRFIGFGLGWPLAIGGLGFLGGLLGGGLGGFIGGSMANRPFYGYPGYGYPPVGFPGPGVGYPGVGIGYPGYY